jgi:hypothetical protein
MRNIIMKSFFFTILLSALCFVFYSCGNKKVETNEVYVNPVFKENLNEVCDIILRRYSVDFTELKTKFGIPVRTVIDSVQLDTEQQTYDSTFAFYYKNITLRYYKRSTDKKYFNTGVELTGQFRAKQFTIIANETKEEVLTLFGPPLLDKNNENSEELTYTLYKDETGAYYDSIVLIFANEQYVGMRYEPYLEIYPEASNDKNNQQENLY